jgi:hypothetical protein
MLLGNRSAAWRQGEIALNKVGERLSPGRGEELVDFRPGRDFEEVALTEREERANGPRLLGLLFVTLLVHGTAVAVVVGVRVEIGAAGQIGVVPADGLVIFIVAVFVIVIVVGARIRFGARAAIFEVIIVVKCGVTIVEKVAG